MRYNNFKIRKVTKLNLRFSTALLSLIFSFLISLSAISQNVWINDDGIPSDSSAILDLSTTVNRNDTTLTTESCAFICGSSEVTFTYKLSTVTYGTVSGQNGTCWMDRNLGASQVADSSTDTNGYGDLFQWGRGDDGHQDRSSGTTYTQSSSDVPRHSNFIKAPSSPYDWRRPQNDNLWQGENGTNNPCPLGWRLPIEMELENEWLSWSDNNATGAFGSPLKLPVAGGRSGSYDSLSLAGSYGFYWSSKASGSGARCVYFYSGGAGMYGNFRAGGGSVRCIKD